MNNLTEILIPLVNTIFDHTDMFLSSLSDAAFLKQPLFIYYFVIVSLTVKIAVWRKFACLFQSNKRTNLQPDKQLKTRILQNRKTNVI
jgi:hypothetical protein